MATTDTRPGTVAYETTGGGTPVLVVHGTTGGADQGVVLGRFLAEAVCLWTHPDAAETRKRAAALLGAPDG